MFGDCFGILNYEKGRLPPQLVEEDAGGAAGGQSEFPGDQSGGFASAEDGPDDAPALLFKCVRPLARQDGFTVTVRSFQPDRITSLVGEHVQQPVAPEVTGCSLGTVTRHLFLPAWTI